MSTIASKRSSFYLNKIFSGDDVPSHFPEEVSTSQLMPLAGFPSV
jgi:hypothetical protein